MFRWCAYCWAFIGESEPLADYRSTHGICEPCVDSDVAWDENIGERARPVRELHARLSEIATAGRIGDVSAVLHEGAALGLGPLTCCSA